jgi:hypothetical protein
MGDRPLARPTLTQETTHRTYIHPCSGIRTHDSSVRVIKDCIHLSPRGHCDRHVPVITVIIVTTYHAHELKQL